MLGVLPSPTVPVPPEIRVVDRSQRGIDMRAAGAEICIHIGIKQRGEVCGGVVDGTGAGEIR